MIKEYKITEIKSYETDNSGYIHVEFRIKGDSKSTSRTIEDDNYIDWIESLDNNRSYGSEVWGVEYYDEDFSTPYTHFDFNEWKNENEDEGTIKKYIYDNVSLNDLPDPE